MLSLVCVHKTHRMRIVYTHSCSFSVFNAQNGVHRCHVSAPEFRFFKLQSLPYFLLLLSSSLSSSLSPSVYVAFPFFTPFANIRHLNSIEISTMRLWWARYYDVVFFHPQWRDFKIEREKLYRKQMALFVILSNVNKTATSINGHILLTCERWVMTYRPVFDTKYLFHVIYCFYIRRKMRFARTKLPSWRILIY